MIGRYGISALLFAGLLACLVPDEALPVLSRLSRSDSREALRLSRAPDEEWDEFELEWRLEEDSLFTRVVRRVELWTPFNRLAFGAKEARIKNDNQFSAKAVGFQRKLEQEYRDEIRFIVSFLVPRESAAMSYRAELRPEKGDLMGPFNSDVLASFRWAGEYTMVRISYSFPKLLLGEWEGPVSLLLVPPSGNADGPWVFDLSKVR